MHPPENYFATNNKKNCLYTANNTQEFVKKRLLYRDHQNHQNNNKKEIQIYLYMGLLLFCFYEEMLKLQQMHYGYEH